MRLLSLWQILLRRLLNLRLWRMTQTEAEAVAQLRLRRRLK